MKTKLLLALFCFSLCTLFAEESKWIDFNKNGQMDLFENPEATIDKRVNDLLNQMTTQEQILLMRELAPAIPRLGIEKYFHGNEALHGVVRPGTFTVFPQAIALSATWNPELIYQVSTVISDEARAKWNALDQGRKQHKKFSDLLAFWSPTVNMARDPRWGRTPETYGEDPYLTSQIGVQFVKGLQGEDPRYLKVVATPKHFAGNNEEHNRFGCPMQVSEQNLRNYYLPAFKALITKGKAASIMSAYNAINGVPCSANSWLLTDILRKEWGFNGYVVTDCGAPGFLVSHHKYAKNEIEAAVQILKAGVDLECGGYCDKCHINTDYLPKAYTQGLVSASEIRSAAFRILRARFKLGLFDPLNLNPYTHISPQVIGCKKHQALALETARQSIVLLKNEHKTLPLNLKKIKKIAVLGINAATAVFGDYSGQPCQPAISPLEGIRQKVGKRATVHSLPWKSLKNSYTLVEPSFFKKLETSYFSDSEFKKQVAREKTKNISFEPANQAPNPLIPKAPMSARWQGKLNVPFTGTYKVGIDTDAKVRLFLDGEKILDTFDGSKKETTVKLEKRSYAIVYEYANPTQSGGLARLKWELPEDARLLFKEEIKLAKKSDVVIAVLGINKSIEREGQDRTTLSLPKDQELFIRKIYKANKNTIVVLVAGSSLTINWMNEHIPAIVNAWYPGEQGGTAIADVLFGDYNPAGRLPLTYYMSKHHLPAFNDYDITKGRTYMYLKEEPLYPFGFGLSYTEFTYSDMQLSSEEITAGDSLQVSIAVTNSGKRAGDEVVQLYIRAKEQTANKPLKKLCGFQRIHLQPKESKRVTFTLSKELYSRWNAENRQVVLGKSMELIIGNSSADNRFIKQLRCR